MLKKHIMAEPPWISLPEDMHEVLSGHQFSEVSREIYLFWNLQPSVKHICKQPGDQITHENSLTVGNRQQADSTKKPEHECFKICSLITQNGAEAMSKWIIPRISFPVWQEIPDKTVFGFKEPRIPFNSLPICEWVSEACAPVVTTFMKYSTDHGCDWQDDSAIIRFELPPIALMGWILTEKSFSLFFFPCVQQIHYQIGDELVLQAWRQQNSSMRQHLQLV